MTDTLGGLLVTISSPRDLAWCRAAFRDLDAPLPGQTALPSTGATTRPGWSSGPVPPGPGTAHLAPAPSTAPVVAQAVSASGTPRHRVDVVGATLLAWDLVTSTGAGHLHPDAAAVRALGIVRSRWDLEESMLWHVFGHFGARGAAAYHDTVGDLFHRGALRTALDEALASGALLRY